MGDGADMAMEAEMEAMVEAVELRDEWIEKINPCPRCKTREHVRIHVTWDGDMFAVHCAECTDNCPPEDEGLYEFEIEEAVSAWNRICRYESHDH